MYAVTLPVIGTAEAWRDAARGLAAANVPPEAVTWHHGAAATGLFTEAPPPSGEAPLTVPRAFVDLARTVCWHADPERFARLYAMLWRLGATPGLMGDRADPQVTKLREMEKAVRRDMHKMKAFLRFREVEADGPRRRFAAWFTPTHHTLEPVAPFLARRFGDMDWAVVTPGLTAVCEGGRVTLSEGGARPDLPEDATEDLWRTYFRNIFNPARLKVKAMQAEMPKKYWSNLPEAVEIADLIATAQTRASAMQAAAPTLPPARAARITERLTMPEPDLFAPDTLQALRAEAKGCTRCPLYAPATQVVMGEGPEDAPLMIVGEQPGDQEDLAGRPFVGPAGQLFDELAAQAGLDRGAAYVTNAVKHFKFEPRGKRRIHQKPDTSEIRACNWWLEAERAIVAPKLVLAMGGTAAQATTGTAAGIMKRRGTFEAMDDGTPVLLTLHPSYLLRVPNAAAKEAATRDVVADLRLAVARLAEITQG